MLRRPVVHRRNRRRLDKSNVPQGSPVVSTNSIVANKWRLSLDKAVVVSGPFDHFTVNGVAPTAFAVVDPTTVDLSYAVNVAAGQDFVIPANDAAIRSQNGGYVVAAAGTF